VIASLFYFELGLLLQWYSSRYVLGGHIRCIMQLNKAALEALWSKLSSNCSKFLADMWRTSYLDFTQFCSFAQVDNCRRPVQVVCYGYWQALKAPLTLRNMSASLPSCSSYKEPSFSQQQCPVTATPLISVQHSRHLQKSLIQARGLSSTFIIVGWSKKLGRRSPRSGNT
jgi:hypothetical protein